MRVRGRGGEAKCPFCGNIFEIPCEIKAKLGNVFSGGRCSCGAVYVFDRTGHNLGEAYVDALVLSCDGDWDMAWKLTPDVDYKIESCYYDGDSHQILDSRRSSRFGRAVENLLFIKLNK